MVPWGRHWKAFKYDGLWCRGVPRSVGGAGKGWGRHWGAFKLLYYHCNTTKIDRVEQARTVCGAEECRGVVLGRGGADIGEPLNYSTTIAIPLK